MPAGDHSNEPLDVLREVVAALDVGPFVNDDAIKVGVAEIAQQARGDGNDWGPIAKHSCGANALRQRQTRWPSRALQAAPVPKPCLDFTGERPTSAPRVEKCECRTHEANRAGAGPRDP